MKLLRYGPAGEEKPGLIDKDGNIRDLSEIVPDIAGEVLSSAGLERLRGIDPSTLPRVEGDPRIGPCVGQVGKFICIGLNYSDHAAESGMAVPPEPIIFMKATSAICGRMTVLRFRAVPRRLTGRSSSASWSARRPST